MNSPTVSVIIPVYNGASFVAKAIESVLQQTLQAKEILVVDDGCTDCTAAVVSGFPKPVVLLRQVNAGPAAARNYGAGLATGDWLAFLDADDVWLPRKLETQIQFGSDPKVAVIACYVRESYVPEPPPIDISFDRLWRRNCIALSSTLVRRTVYQELGGFDEDPAMISVEDYNLWLRISARGCRLLTVPEVLCLYTPGSGSLTSQLARFARAELANLEKISRELKIPAKRVEDRRISIFNEYGRELFHIRDVRRARYYFGCAFRSKPSISNLVWWMVTFSPTVFLDVLRRLRIRSSS